MLAYVVTVLCVLVLYLFVKFQNAYKYWEARQIKAPKPKLLFGNFKTVITKEDSITSLLSKIYEQYPEEKVVGFYQGTSPSLLLRDPDIIKRILVKDFAHFTDRGFGLDNHPATRHLFGLDGDEWRILRHKLTPLFTTGKLRQMMPLLNNAVNEYKEHLSTITENQKSFEMRELNMKYTLKVITSTAFGLDIDTFTAQDNKFIEMAGKVFRPRSNFLAFAMLVDGIFPGIFKKLPFNMIHSGTWDFFMNLVSEIIQVREGKPKVRKDFMDLMIELKEQGKASRTGDEGTTEMEVTDELIVAQALLFYAAGFETSSSTMTFVLYELAKDQNIQNRCYEEIKRVMCKYNDELNYEALTEMEYLSMTFDEALRMHSVAGNLLRKCVSDYYIPEVNLTVEKGTKVYVPSVALHHDEKLFKDPERFDPDRFAADQKASIHGGTYVPFGDGPRNCIGLRFARVQSLLGLAHFLYNYRVVPSEKTPNTLRYDPLSMVLKSADGVVVNIEKRCH